MEKKKKKDKHKSSGGGQVDFGRLLRGLNKNLDKAKEEAAEGGFAEFDDGKYRARCVDAKIGVSKNKRVQVIFTWKFRSGDYKGKEKLDFEGLQEERLHFLLRKLDAMGYDISEMNDLEEDLKEIFADIKKTKPECKITLKTKGEFQNIYVNGPWEDDDEEESDSEEDESSDEDDDEEDSEEDDNKDTKKKKKKKGDDEDEDDDESDDDEEEESDDDDDDSEVDEEEEDDEDEKKSKKKKDKKKDDEDEDESEEEDDDSDDEEDDDEADEDEEEVEDEVDITVGSVVKADTKKYGKVKGTVVELDEKAGKVLLKTEKGTVSIKADKIIEVIEQDAKDVPSKKKKGKK